MVKAIIKIRFKQVLRAILEIGLFRTVFLVGLSVFFVFVIFMQTAEKLNSFYTSGVYLIIITLIQVKRQDKQFAKIHFSNFRLIFFLEYLSLMTPLFIGLIYHMQWITMASAIAITLFIASLDLKPKPKSLNTFIQKLIPSDCFEWKGGVRKNLVFIVIVFIIGIAASFFVGTVPVVIFIMGILPLGFYEKGESLQMIVAFEMGTNRFLLHKIKMQTALFLLLSIPLIIAFLFFFPDKWYIPVTEVFLFLTIHIYIILLKYAFFQPNIKHNGSEIFGAIGAVGIILPFFIPLVWLLSVHFYIKSRENLNFYLNDFN